MELALTLDMPTIRYLKIKLRGNRRRFIIRVTSEGERFLRGIEVDKEGEEITRGYACDEILHIIMRDVIESSTEMRMNNHYATLEEVV